MEMRKVVQLLPGLLAYSERHHSRVNRARQSAYLLEFVSSLMSLQPLPEEKFTSAVSEGKGLSLSQENFVEDDSAPILFKPKAKNSKVKKRKLVENI